MGIPDVHAAQNGGTERARERVASAHGVGDLHLRGGLVGHGAARKDIAAVDAAGEHEHVEVVLAEDEPAFVFDIKPRVAKHAADEHQFLVVDLQDVAALDAGADGLLGVEVLS